MRLELTGHPLHTRALSITVDAAADGMWTVVGELVDVRKRGFTPVGTEVQGAGIIHQMGLEAGVDPRRRVIETLTARQPVVAFEASAATLGESCRDVVGAWSTLRGMRLDDPALLAHRHGRRRRLLAPPCAWRSCSARPSPSVALDPVAPSDAVHRQLLRRDLIVDGSEQDDGRLAIAIQLSDLCTAPAAGGERAMARFRRHDELRLSLILDGWPATIVAARGAERSRTVEDFAARDVARSRSRAGRRCADCRSARAATQALVAAVGAHLRLRDALLQLGGALIQCRASFPDKWLNVAGGDPGTRA